MPKSQTKKTKSAFKKTDLKKYRQLLLDKRKELMDEMVALMKEQVSSTPKETTGELSSHAYHMADQGTDAMEREMAFMFASKSGRLVYHIDEALRRIEEGVYGLCFQCKKPITVSRLKAVPHARLCIKCKESEEGRRTAGK
jgi:DnaK suppressor protein